MIFSDTWINQSSDKTIANILFSDLSTTQITIIVSVSVASFIITAYLAYYCLSRCLCFKDASEPEVADGLEANDSALIVQAQPSVSERAIVDVGQPIDEYANKITTNYNRPNMPPYKRAKKSQIESPSSPQTPSNMPTERDTSLDVSSTCSNASRKSPPLRRAHRSLLTHGSKISGALTTHASKTPRSALKSRISLAKSAKSVRRSKSPLQRKRRRRRGKQLPSPISQQQKQKVTSNVQAAIEQKGKQPARADQTSIVTFEAPITAEIIRQHLKDPSVKEYSMFKSPSFFD